MLPCRQRLHCFSKASTPFATGLHLRQPASASVKICCKRDDCPSGGASGDDPLHGLSADQARIWIREWTEFRPQDPLAFTSSVDPKLPKTWAQVTVKATLVVVLLYCCICLLQEHSNPLVLVDCMHVACKPPCVGALSSKQRHATSYPCFHPKAFCSHSQLVWGLGA